MSIATQPTQQLDLAALEAELRPLSSEKLKVRFIECQGQLVNFIAEAAVCVKLLKERGEDVARIPMASVYLRIADGRILPELFAMFLESSTRSVVESLPLSDQKRIVANPMVPVIEATESGYTTRMVDLRVVPKEVAKLAISPTGIRSPEEQKAVVGARKAQATIARPAKGSVVHNEPLNRTVTIKLTDSELAALKVHAAKAGNLDVATMLRRFVLKTDAFKMPK